MTSNRLFQFGFLVGLLIVAAVNLLAAHLFSDCGLPAVLGASACADDIVRAGFPVIFLEQGGFAFRSIFNLPFLLLDIFIGLGFAALCGLIARWYKKISTTK